MKRLSLEELKAQKGNLVANLEAIKAGNDSFCHCDSQRGGSAFLNWLWLLGR